MTNTKRTLDEPQIRQLLAGLVRCGNRFYRPNPDTGFHMPVAARSELKKLVSQVTASRLLREALSVGLISEEKIDPANASAKQGEGKRDGAESGLAAAIAASATDDDIEDEEPDKPGSRHSKSPLGLGDIEPSQLHRYQLVKSGDWYGYWDDEYGYQELVSRSKEDTLERIYQLQRQGSHGPFQWPTN